jgi:hypothetical protein
MATLFNTKIKDTYQSLLKLEDNTILTTTSKNITDGLGNASPLYMSTTRIGIGTNAPTSALTINGSITFSSYNNTIASGSFPLNAIYTASVVLCSSISDSGGVGIIFKDSGGSAYARFGFPGNLNNTIGQSTFGVVPDLGARLGVRGAGSTSATTSLLVQDSGGTQIFKIQDDGQVIVNKGNQQVTFAGSGGISRIQVPNEMTIGLGSSFNAMKIYFDGRVGLQNDALFINNGNVGIGTSTPSAPLEVRGLTNNSVALRVGGLNTGRDFTFNPYYATNTYGGLFSNESGNITLGASLGTDNGSGIGIILGAPSGTRTALLQVKGTGSTSATTSLLVQNSSGTELLKVTDDGLVTGAAITSTGTLRAANNKLEVYNSGNQVIMRNPALGNHFYIGPSNVCGCDTSFICPSIFLSGGGLYGTNTGIATNTQAYAMSTQLNPIALANSCLINLNGGGRLQGGAYGQYIRVEGNMTLDSLANQLIGFYFNPTLIGAFSPQNVRAIHSTYGGGYFNTATPQASAVLQADSTTQGVLFPRMTTAQKLAIASPVGGLQVFDTTLNQMSYYNGTAWINF